MAKTEVVERAKVEELKRDLKRLVKVIAEEEEDDGRGGGRLENYEQAVKALMALKELKFGMNGIEGKKKNNNSLGVVGKEGDGEAEKVPEHFLCPISAQLMRDPVVLESGQTYDRPFIQKWLNSGNRICPQSQQVLRDTTLIPNDLVRRMISQWCSKQGVVLPCKSVDEDLAVACSDQKLVNNLLDKVTLSVVHEQKQAIKELRLLTKRNNSFRALLGENPDGVSTLLSTLSSPSLFNDLEAREDSVTTILNISINESNKKIVGDNPHAIPLLIKALNSGTMETRRNAAAALFTLSALDSNKIKIGELGAISPLIELLECGSLTAKRDAASAIFNLCTAHKNRERAVDEGAVRVALKAVMHGTLVDECLAILALLCNSQEAIEEIGGSGGVPCLLTLIKESSCGRTRENAVAVLFSICMMDRTTLKEVGEEESMNRTISQLAQNGTSRARRKAAGIIERLKRVNTTCHSC